MLIKKGIILEINKNNVVVLTQAGEFLQLKKHRFIPIIGEEYEGSVYHEKTFFKPLALAACLLLLINVGIIYRTYFQVYNTIDVSINPSVRLYVNRKNDILMTEAINEDGGILLSNIHTIKGESCENGILDIIECAIKLKYLNSQNSKVKIHSKKDNAINYTNINKVLKKLDTSASSSENAPQNSQHKFNKSDVIVENAKKPSAENKDTPSTNNHKDQNKLNDKKHTTDEFKDANININKNEDKNESKNQDKNDNKNKDKGDSKNDYKKKKSAK